ncbi:MAG: hypothetical protein LBK27_02870 [Treponema sp.]|jgi:hypothetical protein|nr:hypothetical protein [Treponema sp.]
MTPEQEIRVKALEIAALILGPSEEKPIEAQGEFLWKVSTEPFKSYLFLADGIDSLTALLFSSALCPKTNETRSCFIKMSEQNRMDLYYKYLLFCYYIFDIPLTVFAIIQIARAFGYTKVYIYKYQEIFVKNLKLALVEKYGAEHLNIRLFINDGIIDKLSKKNAFFLENRSLTKVSYKYPDISENSEFSNAINNRAAE